MRSTVQIKSSPIHGKGLFAKRRLRKGEYIASFKGRKTSKNGMHVLWLEEDDGSMEGMEVRNSMRYMNHAPKPNAELDGYDVYALRSIQPGEEITIHYGNDWDDVGH